MDTGGVDRPVGEYKIAINVGKSSYCVCVSSDSRHSKIVINGNFTEEKNMTD